MKKYKWYYFLDASTTRTGIVLLRSDYRKILVTDLDFSGIIVDKMMSKAQKHVAKFKAIKLLLDDFTKQYPPEDTLYVEGIFVKSAFLNSSEVIIKFHGFLISYFINYDIDYYPPKTIKKAITGNGNTNKDDVREILERKYKIKFMNLDQSDAFAVFVYYVQTQNIEVGHGLKHIEIIKHR